MERPKNDRDLMNQVWDALFMNDIGIVYQLKRLRDDIEKKKVDWKWVFTTVIMVGLFVAKVIEIIRG